MTKFYRTRVICTAARYKELHISLLLRRNMIAFDDYCIWLGRSVVILGCRTRKISKRKIGFSVTETVVQKEISIPFSGRGPLSQLSISVPMFLSAAYAHSASTVRAAA